MLLHEPLSNSALRQPDSETTSSESVTVVILMKASSSHDLVRILTAKSIEKLEEQFMR